MITLLSVTGCSALQTVSISTLSVAILIYTAPDKNAARLLVYDGDALAGTVYKRLQIEYLAVVQHGPVLDVVREDAHEAGA